MTTGLLLHSCASTPTPPPVQPSSESNNDIVVGTRMVIESQTLDQTRAINVVLPMGYDKSERDYPVIYLIDGGVEQDLLPVAGFGALASLSWQYREFILVGVATQNRQLELTTPSTVPYDLEQIPTNGGADKFRKFIRTEVQPMIDKTYRTTGETAMLGESLAGLFIVDTFLREPESFTHYIAVSPSLWWNNQTLAKTSAQYLQAANFPKDRSLFLASADEQDIVAALIPLHKALRETAPAGLQWWYQPMPQEHHNTIYHPATLNALRLIFAMPKEK